MNARVLSGIFLSTASLVALAAGSWAQSANDSATLETVTVTGYRASLQQALETKRDSVGVVDSIVAEDIGKYPATNIADSLQRVPGVALSRDTRSDEGKSVTVRGLNPSYTIVTINGNPVHAETTTSIGSNNRSVDMDLFGADLFSRVDFYKSPQANLDEGGIGGTIDLRTPHPFDYNEMKFNYGAQYSVNTQRAVPLPGVNLQVSNTWGPFGALFALTFKESDYELYGHETTGLGQTRNEFGRNSNNMTFDLGPSNGGYDPRANIGSYSVDNIQQALVGRFERNHIEQNKRTRWSSLASFQFRPNEKWDVTLDFIGGILSEDHNEYTIGMPFRSMSTTATGYAACKANPALIGSTGCSGLVPTNIAIDKNNNLYGTFANSQWLTESRWYEGNTHFASAALNAKYQVTDDWAVKFELSENTNNSFYSDDRIYTSTFNATTNFDPTVNYKAPLLTTNIDLTNTGIWAAPSIDVNLYKEGDRVIIGKLNSVYETNTGVSFLGKVKADVGLSYVSSQKTNNRYGAGSMVKARALDGKFASMTFAQMAMNRIPYDNIYDGVDHPSTILQWASVPRSFYESMNINSLVLHSTPQDLSTYNVIQFPNLFNVTEAVQSAYAMFDTSGELFGRSLKLNGGLRFAQTRLWGYNYHLCSSGSGLQCQNRLHNSYDNVLPNFSLAYDFVEDFVFRAAYGKTVTRPSLGNIAGGLTIGSRFNAAASNGNSELKPMTANNVDLGVEWYFQPESVLSVGVFYKGVKGLVSNQTTSVTFGSLGLPESLLDCTVWCDGTGHIPSNLIMTLTHPVNLNPMVVKGFEVYYQQPFNFLPEPFDGLGALANFTYTAGRMSGKNTGFPVNALNGPGTGAGVSVPEQIAGLSPYTYSTTLYYEKDDISVRLSYNWRSKSVSQNGNYYETNMHLIQQARGTLDASLGYSLLDNLEIRFDATNLLNSVEYAYLGNAVQGMSYPGRYANGGDDTSHVFYSYWHGRNFTLSLRGHL